MIHIFGPHNRAPEGMQVINVTSRSREDWSRTLSPFFLGPVELYDDHVAVRMENAWQFSKVYPQHVDAHGEPTEQYWKWARLGWQSSWAHRYPMGRGAKPLYSWWGGEKLTYVQARRKIYIPLYAQCVRKTEAWQRLQQMYQEQTSLAFWDFDGYDRGAMTWEQVMDCETKKTGHALVLGMMLEGVV